MSHWLKFLRPVPIAATGSVARDHLANERTFLAWSRTGLGFIALGVAIKRFDAMEATPALLEGEHTQKAPIVLVGLGSGCLIHGTFRYLSILRLLQKGLFRPNIAGVALVVLASTGLAAGGTSMVMAQSEGR